MPIKPAHHRWIYLISLALVAVGLPLSKALISIGGITLAINFLLEGQYSSRWHRFKQDPVAVLLVAFYLFIVAGMLWTEDPLRGLSDLRVMLPLFLFPIIFSLSKPLSAIEFQVIAGLFTASVLVTSVFSTFEFLNLRNSPGADFRTISLFTSHIRYSLMVCLGYLFLLNMAWNAHARTLARFIYILLAVWFSIFVFILQSMTGIVVWFLCSYFLLMYTMGFIRQQHLKTVGLTILSVTPVIVGAYLIFQIDAFYPDRHPDFSELETHSAGGELYRHDTTNLMLENGDYINFHIAYHELEIEWNKRSNIPFWGGEDRSGQPLNATLIRYLTSKGLHKDSVGVNALTDVDVSAIETGIANVRFTYGNPIDNRVYTVIWEIDRMINEKRVQGHSVTQRFVFWKTGWQIFKEHRMLGVGTGGGNKAYASMYDRMGVKLNEGNRLRAHNQFLSVAVTLGAVGVLLFFLSLIAPFLLMENANSFLYIGFSIVLYASMLNEDTLETQVGVTLFAFFNSFLLYGTRSLALHASNTSS